MLRAVDETGNRYGKLIVVERDGSSNVSGNAKWKCLCDCGNTSSVKGSSLREGRISSCGCQVATIHRLRMVTHGMSKHPAYSAYSHAKARCDNARHVCYADYGGRGIQFKFASFEQFWEELGPTWEEGLSIDRKDNDGHYEPGNCRWATVVEQQNNKRSNILLNVGGRSHNLYDIARLIGRSYQYARRKYVKYGQNFEDWPEHLRSKS